MNGPNKRFLGNLKFLNHFMQKGALRRWISRFLRSLSAENNHFLSARSASLEIGLCHVKKLTIQEKNLIMLENRSELAEQRTHTEN